MNIKAQGLLNAVKWIEEEYGISTLQEIVRACSPAVRERYVSAVAINWHPMMEFVEFLEVAERIVGKGDGKLAETIGAVGARVNLRGATIRWAFYVARPDFMLRRVAGLWRQFNDEGDMKIITVEDHRVRVEVTGVSNPQWLFCCTLTGWCRELADATGLHAPTSRHTECRAKGGARCIFDVRGMRKTLGPGGDASGPPPSSGTPSSGSFKT